MEIKLMCVTATVKLIEILLKDLTVHVTPSLLPSMTTSGRPPTPVILLNRPYELTTW